jgi:type 1 glutamine amidotransferase
MTFAKIVSTAAAAALLVAAGSATAQADKAAPAKPIGAVLVFHATKGFAHPSIPNGVAAIKKLGQEHHFQVDETVDPAAFTPANLAKYKAIVFLSTTGDVLPAPAQRAALEGYIRKGGGYFGIHAAADMGAVRDNWPWYRNLVGGAFKGHTGVRIYTDKPLPDAIKNFPGLVKAGPLSAAPADADDSAGMKTISWEPARMVIEDQSSPMVAGWGKSVTRSDEWYGFLSDPRPKVHVIASVDEKTYKPAGGQMGDHPVTWCHAYDGGRSVYTVLGHPKAAWTDPQLLGHMLGGIELAAGAVPFNCKI